MEFVTIILVSLLTNIWIWIAIKSGPKQKIFQYAGTVSFVIAVMLLALQLYSTNKASQEKEKEKEKQEFLRQKYDFMLKDDVIASMVKQAIDANFDHSKLSLSTTTFPTNKFMSNNQFSMKLIAVPSSDAPQYKVIDPTNYGIQKITPLIPILSHMDNKKYYVGLVAVSKNGPNDSNLLPVITKYRNGLYDIENIRIDNYSYQAGYQYDFVHE